MRRLSLAALLACFLTALAQDSDRLKVGDVAPDFPPGQFSDGGHYSLADLRGRVVVLFFYEKDCPSCRKLIPDRNKLAASFAGLPVKFLAIGAGDSPGDVASYIRDTGLAMPTYADNLSLMEKRYGFTISLKNIYQFRVIGPDGKIVALGSSVPRAKIEAAAEKAEPSPWSPGAGKADPKVQAVADAFEGGQFALGGKLLTPLRRNAKKEVAEQANALHDALKTQAKAYLDEAKASDEPLKAYDLLARVIAALPGDELAKQATEAQKPILAQKSVAAELAARKAFVDLEAKLSRLPPAARAGAAQACRDFAKKHAGTTTATKATALADELGS